MKIPKNLRRVESPEEWARAVFQTVRIVDENVTGELHGIQRTQLPKANRQLTDEQLWGDRR